MGVHMRVAIFELSELYISSNPDHKIIDILRPQFLETRGLRRAWQEELQKVSQLPYTDVDRIHCSICGNEVLRIFFDEGTPADRNHRKKDMIVAAVSSISQSWDMVGIPAVFRKLCLKW